MRLNFPVKTIFFIKILEKYGVNLKVKHTQNFLHFSKKFTVEFWIKLNSINVSIFSKDSFTIEIQNGEFIATYQNKLLPKTKVDDFQIMCDTWLHVAITYKRKTGKIRVFVNCIEISIFHVTFGEEIGLKGDIYIGNNNLDGELTEIRIWNHEIPIKLLKENYKSPLPILAENKRKLRMKINKQEENIGKKKFEFNKNSVGPNSNNILI